MDRTVFKLPELVSEIFGFLGQYGMTQITADPTFVRYESDRVFLNIYHGRSSFEIGAEIGLRKGAKAGKAYPIGNLIELAGPKSEAKYRKFAAAKPDAVRIGLAQLRDIIVDYAKPALTGDESVFAELERVGNEWRKNFADEVHARQVRPEAEAAFKAKNFDHAVRLYESIRESFLTPAEVKKLEYARKYRE
jgi:hypothetical protein